MDNSDTNDWYDRSRQEEMLQEERTAVGALCLAIEYHCKGLYVPEEVARYCRLHAVNLNRRLARLTGMPLPPLDQHMRDFTDNENQVR